MKWANSLVEKGIDLSLFTISRFSMDDYDNRINIHSFSFPSVIKSKSTGSFIKLFYLFSIFRLRKIINQIKPDLIHAHYASSYGLLGALTGFKPFLISVWGIDITIFPKKNFLTRSVLKYILSKADRIFATSAYLAKETSIYTDKTIIVIPFGVDTDRFSLVPDIKEKNQITIGTIKPLENKYGLDFLLKIFVEIKKELPKKNLRLLFVGGGSMENKLKKLVNDFGLNDCTVFTGKVKHKDIHLYHNKLDIAVYFSDYESFGVSVLESMACEKPVIVSDVGGLPDLVINNQNGYVIKRGEKVSAINAIKDLIVNEEKRIKFGKKGRQLVLEKYQWENSVEVMINNYHQFTNNSEK